jgi:hypothetical protein
MPAGLPRGTPSRWEPPPSSCPTLLRSAQPARTRRSAPACRGRCPGAVGRFSLRGNRPCPWRSVVSSLVATATTGQARPSSTSGPSTTAMTSAGATAGATSPPRAVRRAIERWPVPLPCPCSATKASRTSCSTSARLGPARTAGSSSSTRRVRATVEPCGRATCWRCSRRALRTRTTVFLSYFEPDRSDRARKRVTEPCGRAEATLAALPPEQAMHWRHRLHCVPVEAYLLARQRDRRSGARGRHTCAHRVCDRPFPTHPSGGPADVARHEAALSGLFFLAFEARHYDFER